VRFLNSFSRAVDLIVAIRVEENPVFCPVAADVGPPNYMVVVPASSWEDDLVANRADTVLFFP
jgi:hypothetical protein